MTIPSRGRFGEDLSLNGYFIKPDKAVMDGKYIHLWDDSYAGSVVILVHGFNANIGKTWPNKQMMSGQRRESVIGMIGAPLAAVGFNVLAIDLRNHGRSGDSLPFTLGVHEADDVLAAIDWLGLPSDLHRGFPIEKIGVWGESAGGATALRAAVKRKDIPAIVIDGVPSSFLNVFFAFVNLKFTRPLRAWGLPVQKFPQVLLDHWLWWISIFMPEGMSFDLVNHVPHMKHVEARILHSHGTLDRVCPFEPSAVMLRQAAEERPSNYKPYEFFKYEGGHIQAYLHKGYIERVIRLFAEELAGKR